MSKPVTVHRLKKGLDRQSLERKWPKMDQDFDDPEELDVGDLPTDSFVPDPDDNWQEDNDLYSDSEIEDEDNDDISDYDQSELQLNEQDKETTNSREMHMPMASKSWHGEKPGPKLPIKGIERLNKMQDKVVVLTEFQDGQKLWIAQEFLNRKAMERFLDSDTDITEMKYNLRSRNLASD